MKSKHSASSTRWLNEHFKDEFVKQAHAKKLRSRAYFKLDQIQQKYKIFKPETIVLDLGSAPGGWSQFIATQIGKKGKVIACDILPMESLDGVDFIQGDFREESIFEELLNKSANGVDSIVSDMAPNFTGIPSVDIPRAFYLADLAIDMVDRILKPKGSFIIKLFQGEGFDLYLKNIRSKFNVVKIEKPDASRARSREVYLICLDYKANH